MQIKEEAVFGAVAASEMAELSGGYSVTEFVSDGSEEDAAGGVVVSVSVELDDAWVPLSDLVDQRGVGFVLTRFGEEHGNAGVFDPLGAVAAFESCKDGGSATGFVIRNRVVLSGTLGTTWTQILHDGEDPLGAVCTLAHWRY